MVSNACSRFLATARISPCVVAQGTCFDRKKDDWKGKMQEWSGKRDSNPQPSAWKADALAVELFPHFRGALSQASLADPRASACPVLHRSSRQSTCLLQPRQLLACATLLVQKWWRGVDLNHRSHRRQIYSLFPLATREPLHSELQAMSACKIFSLAWACPALFSGALLPRPALAFVRHSSAARMCLRKTGPFGKHFFVFFRFFFF